MSTDLSHLQLHKRMSMHKAWRVAFVAVPVPALLLTAVATLLFGTDHPNGKWSNRHSVPATSLSIRAGHRPVLDGDEIAEKNKSSDSEEAVTTNVYDAGYNSTVASTTIMAPVEVAVNEPLTWATASKILLNPLTWLPALAYMTTFGFELAVDSVMAQVILTPHPSLGQLNAGYLASVFGLLNLFTRPLGGFLADRLYANYGVKSKKYLVIALGVMQGVFTIGFGKFLQSKESPDLGVMMGFVVLMAFCNEFANGANFSLVPHCNSYNNGVMSGLVGGFGNLGGIFYALIFRFRPHQGVAWVISGILALVVNAVLIFFPSPNA
jgi:NNP family nitrate/nitrite transporter-like MFS transporter